MATPIDQIGQHELTPTLKALAKAEGTTEHTDWIRSGGNAALVIQFIDQQRGVFDKNPYEMSVEDQLTALRRANDEEKWGMAEEDFTRLGSTAPAWPKGKHAYRSLRIRFGEGGEGVALTFERHVAHIKAVFTESGFWRWEHLHSAEVPYKDKPVKRLRLLNGNNTHKPMIEWVMVDLDTHRKRKSITAVRDAKSLADELLVIAWMFPEMIKAIDYDKLPGLFAGGYEVNVPEYGGGEWRHVVCVDFGHAARQVNVYAFDRGSDRSYYSVPVLRE